MLNWIDNCRIEAKGVINIGCYDCAAYSGFKNLGIVDMIFIEPIPEVFESGRNRINKLKSSVENIHFFNVAISNYNGESPFFVSNNKYSSSLKPFHKHLEFYPKIKTHKQTAVKVKRLDSLFEDAQLEIDNYNFILIDTNGCDYEALEGAGKLLENINFIIAEVFKVELYKGSKTISKINKYLHSFGFERVMTKWRKKKNQKTWGDVLYFKD